MFKIGLTGGIGCGKSTAINAFQDLNIEIIDADKIARDIVSMGSTALEEIAQLFGPDILLENGELDRKTLKQIIFAPSDEGKNALSDLESITHPKIRSEIERRMDLASNNPKSNNHYFLVDIPLLVEKNYQTLFDRVIVVDCFVEQQIERVKERDELNENTILKIIEQQASREERLNIATDVLDNSKDINYLLDQVNQLHDMFVSLSLR